MSAIARLAMTMMTKQRRTTRGSCNAQAKLSEDAVREMRRSYGSRLPDGTRVTIRWLAAKWGVGKSTVHEAVTGQKWAHV